MIKYLKWEGADIAYRLEGKGPAVLLLHGFCEDSQVWEEFRTDLLEKQFSVLRIDLPGFGKSSAIMDISIREMAECVKYVLDQLSIEQLLFIGHSMGGYVGLAFAEICPERLSGLGLFHSHPYADSEEKKQNRLKSIAFIENHGHILYVKQLIPKLFTEKFAGSHTFLVDKLIYQASLCPPEGISAGLKAMAGRPDRSGVLKTAEFPVLFIVGLKDTAIPADHSLEQTHLPKTASVHLLEKTAHMGMFEASQKCQKIVRDFTIFCFRR